MAQTRLALGILGVILAGFALITADPFSAVQPVRIDAFIPAHVTAMLVERHHHRETAVLAVLDAALARVGGLQRAVALYLSWHAGFAIFVIAYGVEGQQIWDAAVARQGRSGDRRERRHEVRQPLTTIIANADAGINFLDRTTQDIDGASRR